MEIDASRVCEELAATREAIGGRKPPDRWAWLRNWLDPRVVRLWGWIFHPSTKFIVLATISIPNLGDENASTWWTVLGVLAAYQHLDHYRTSAVARLALTNERARLREYRLAIETVLTEAHRIHLEGTTCRLSILLPRKRPSGEWELVAVMRSDGIEVTNSRPLRVFQNKTDESEGVSGHLFSKQVDGGLERDSDPADPATYSIEMCVSKSFVHNAILHPRSCRNPRYVLAFVLRFGGKRMGVLAIDNDKERHLSTKKSAKSKALKDLRNAEKTDHTERRQRLEVVADTLPAALAPIFIACGVNP